jgi:L-threonylcarbamoyladenylate synthase
MKYRHYSPKATVILYEAGRSPPSSVEILEQVGQHSRIGLVRTESWSIDSAKSLISAQRAESNGVHQNSRRHVVPGFAGMLLDEQATNRAKSAIKRHELSHEGASVQLLDIGLGHDTGDIARGLFSALRDLDRQDVDAIFVEGIDDNEGDIAAAIMNRLRKAAEIQVEG